VVLAQSQLKEVQEKSTKDVKVAVQRKDNKITALEAKVKDLTDKLASKDSQITKLSNSSK
jgi:peptidoglycan hydrolase CwlO-like protein